MIISSEDAARRLTSSSNLINRLRASSNGNSPRGKAMSLFGIGKATPASVKPEQKVVETQTIQPEVMVIPEIVEANEGPNLDSLLDNANSKIKLELAHNEALDTLVDSVKQLRANLATEEKPAKLADIASKMSRIVDQIRAERNKSSSGKTVNIHLYNPTQRSIKEYQSVEV